MKKLLLQIGLTLACTLLVSTTYASKYEARCKNWCNGTSQCAKCSVLPTCGTGFWRIKKFGGLGGKNWYACKVSPNTSASNNQNKKNCETWCGANRCSHCSVHVRCGTGSDRVRKFQGPGKNWYGCLKKKRRINSEWPGTTGLQPTHKHLVVSAGGFFGSKDLGGFEYFCEDHLKGYSSIRCISSWTSYTTNAAKLATNIRDLANAMRQNTPNHQAPTVILIGKSMGGCKLAEATRQLPSNLPVRLFVGADVSCSISRHWSKGIGDAVFVKGVHHVRVFYQNKAGERMTGSPVAYVGSTNINPAWHTDINLENFDFRNDRKIPGYRVCPAIHGAMVGHKDLDDCVPLMKGIKTLVLKKLGL